MIIINSYIKKGDLFLPYQEVQMVDNQRYVYGGVEIVLWGNKILDLEAWDLVDQLWCYFSTAYSEIKKGNSFSSHFPDQPLFFKFRILERDKIGLLFDYGGKGEIICDKSSFLKELSTQGILFLNHLGMINPSHKCGYDYHTTLFLK